MDDIIHTEDFTTAKGTHYRVEVSYDDFADEPWNYCDSHGPVSEWTTRDKRAGEVILAADGRSKRFYNFQEAIKKAKAEGWDAEPYKTGTKGEQAVRAVMTDFKHLKAWCDDEWHYVVLRVALIDSEGEEITEYDDYLGGVEFGYGMEYWKEEAANMAEELERTLETATDKQLAWLRSTCAPCKVERAGI